MDPGFNVAEQTFVAAGRGVRLDAFEQYIRGIRGPATECEDLPDNHRFDGALGDLALEYLHKAHDQPQPFFLAVGFYRPHLPFVAPRKYFDLYPLDRIAMPQEPADDWADIPRLALANTPEGDTPEARAKAVEKRLSFLPDASPQLLFAGGGGEEEKGKGQQGALFTIRSSEKEPELVQAMIERLMQ